MKATKTFYVNESSIASRVSAYLILDSKGNEAGKVHVLRPKDGTGRLQVTLYDFTGKHSIVQSASASGCGYNKLDAAMAKLSFNGRAIKDVGSCWDKQIEIFGFKVIRVL